MEIMPMLRPIGQVMNVGGSGMARAPTRPVETVRSLRGVSKARLARQLLHANDLSLLVGLQQPNSRGDLFLTSADPHIVPRIDYSYLQEQHDLDRMREGLRVAARLLRTDA